jgi:hypothetical protein
MIISGLSPGSIYHFQVVSKNAAGDAATSGDTIFATAAYTSVTPATYGSSDVYAPITFANGNGYTFETFKTFAPSISYKSVTVTLTCSDALSSTVAASGCSSISYCIDASNTCSPSLSYSGNIVLSDPGTWYVRYYSIDASGNIEPTKESIVVIALPLSSSNNTNAVPMSLPLQSSVLKKLDIPSNFQFTKTLQLNQASPDVYYLQQILNSDSDTTITFVGSGSSGKETVRFGQLTRLAVIKFQQKYAAEVLVPAKLKQGTGIVGGNTIKKLNQLLSQLR